jgi:uncharacterized damage-inducible protein DinB
MIGSMSRKAQPDTSPSDAAASSPIQPLIETWAIHNRSNLYLLEAVPEDALVMEPPVGRPVARRFAHMHAIRLAWIKAAGPDLLAGLPLLGDSPGKEELRSALEASGEVIARLLAAGLAAGRIKNFKPHPTAFLGYIIAHEAHHRGQIDLALEQLQRPLEKKVSYGLWEWGVR